jgi:hypothetical protein
VGRALDDGVEGRDFEIDAKTERGHGREERRSYVVIQHPEGIRQQDDWPKLCVVGMCHSERTVHGKTSCEVRYFSGSKQAGARCYGRCLRNHWRIENNLHWQMDITFAEDQNRTAQARRPRTSPSCGGSR